MFLEQTKGYMDVALTETPETRTVSGRVADKMRRKGRRLSKAMVVVMGSFGVKGRQQRNEMK